MGSFHSDKELHSNPSTLSTSFWVTLGKTISVAQVSSLVTEAVSKPSPRTPWLLQTAWPLSDSPRHAAAELYLLPHLSFLGISSHKGIVMFSDSEKTLMESMAGFLSASTYQWKELTFSHSTRGRIKSRARQRTLSVGKAATTKINSFCPQTAWEKTQGFHCPLKHEDQRISWSGS